MGASHLGASHRPGLEAPTQIWCSAWTNRAYVDQVETEDYSRVPRVRSRRRPPLLTLVATAARASPPSLPLARVRHAARPACRLPLVQSAL